MKRGTGVKLGVIGVGSMGKNHARIAALLPGIKLVGVADANQTIAEEVGRQIGVPFHDDYQQLLPDVEALIIATPTQTHFEIALFCLNAGKHLLIEKPFTGSSGTARTLASLAQEKNLILTIGLIERFNPAFQKLRKELKGEKIIGIDIKRLSPFPERISDTDVVFDMMFHDLDLMLALIPDEIIDIRGKGEKIRTKMLDRAIVSIAFKAGPIARLEASRVFGVKSRKLVVTSEKYLIEADLINKTVYIRDFSNPTPSTLPVKPVDQITEELSDFRDAIKYKQSPAVTAVDALRVLSLAEEVQKACS